MRKGNVYLAITAYLGLLCLLSGCFGTIRADIKLDMKNYEEAAPLYQEYLSENPNDFRARSKLGFAYLKMGRTDEALRELTRASEAKSDDPYTILYLGMTYLNKEDPSKAIETWQRYRDPKSPLVEEEIRRQLTVLLMVDSQKRAAKALAEEKGPEPVRLDAKTIAVCNFQDLSPDSGYRAFQKGLAAMLITDLSKVKSLKVVERLRMQALLEEMRLGQSGIVDPATAPRVGRLIGAGNVVLGNLSRGSIKVTTSVSGASPGTVSVAAEEKNFFELPGLIIKELAKIMGVTLSEQETQAIGVPHTKVYQALVHYGQALDALDAGKWEDAKNYFKMAIEADPQFQLAKDGYDGSPGAGTPSLTSLTAMSLSQLAIEVEKAVTASLASQADADKAAAASAGGGGGGDGGGGG